MLTHSSLFHRLVENGERNKQYKYRRISDYHIFMCVHITERNPLIIWIVEPSGRYPTCLLALCNLCSMSQAFDVYQSDNTFAICQSPYAFISFWAPCFAPWSFMCLCLCLSVWMIMWGHSLGRCWERMITCSESSSQRHQINETHSSGFGAGGWEERGRQELFVALGVSASVSEPLCPSMYNHRGWWLSPRNRL